MGIPIGIAVGIGGYFVALNNLKLSEHFYLRELLVTNTGIPNLPGPIALRNLCLFADNVLEPIREITGPIVVTSGFRSPAVNRAVGGSETSYHLKGLAADLTFPAIGSERAFELIKRSGISLDQVILYHPKRGGHVHVGWSPTRNRNLYQYQPETGKLEPR